MVIMDDGRGKKIRKSGRVYIEYNIIVRVCDLWQRAATPLAEFCHEAASVASGAAGPCITLVFVLRVRQHVRAGVSEGAMHHTQRWLLSDPRHAG